MVGRNGRREQRCLWHRVFSSLEENMGHSSGRRTLRGGVLLGGHSYYAFSLQVINAKDIKDSVMPIGYVLISLRIVMLLVQYFVHYHYLLSPERCLPCMVSNHWFAILQLFTHGGLSILWFHIYAH